MIITPSNLWLAHRAACGGKSTITGAALPETIEDCAVGPQETHYAMACFIAEAHGDGGLMPIPSKVTTERATALREEAQRIGRSVRGLLRGAPEVADGFVAGPSRKPPANRP